MGDNTKKKVLFVMFFYLFIWDISFAFEEAVFFFFFFFFFFFKDDLTDTHLSNYQTILSSFTQLGLRIRDLNGQSPIDGRKVTKKKKIKKNKIKKTHHQLKLKPKTKTKRFCVGCFIVFFFFFNTIFFFF